MQRRRSKEEEEEGVGVSPSCSKFIVGWLKKALLECVLPPESCVRRVAHRRSATLEWPLPAQTINQEKNTKIDACFHQAPTNRSET